MGSAWPFLLAALLLPGQVPAIAAEAPAARSEAAEVTVDYRDGTYYGSLSLAVPVAPQQALDVLTDFEHMADFVPNLRSSKLLARAGNVYRIAQQGKANFGPLSFDFESVRQIEVFPEGRLVAQGISGSPRSIHSELRISATPAGSRLDYRVEMVPDHWLPSGIGTHFIRHELAEQFMALGREMERRQKARSRPQG